MNTLADCLHSDRFTYNDGNSFLKKNIVLLQKHEGGLRFTI